MESLLESYGSGDDDDNDQIPSEQQTVPVSAEILPDRAGFRDSLFSSLPPPRISSWKRVIDQDLAASGASFKHGDVAHVQQDVTNSSALQMRSMDARFSSPGQQFRDEVSEYKDAGPVRGQEGDIKANAKRPSLFSALPPPWQTGRSILGGISSHAGVGKRAVEFRPPINMSILQDDADTDNESLSKRRHTWRQSGSGSGLAAILPPPKNSLSTLGSGALGAGRRAALETDIQSSSPNDATTPNLAATFPDVQTETNVTSECSLGAQFNIIQGSVEAPLPVEYDNSVDYHYMPEISTSEGYYNSYPEIATSEGYQNYYQEQVELQQQDVNAVTAQDPLASMMMKEKRRSGSGALPTFVEVKQSDLTAKTIREDQLRTTGIAFGPAYKAPSTAGKPSKLHKRKHQIGSLYYDMKQKEMELVERRAKGLVTKSMTQAKYGW